MMDSISQISMQYGPVFMRKRRYLSWRAPIICQAIQEVLNPTSVLDLGCAHGDLVKGFLDLGINAYGIDGSRWALEFVDFDRTRLFIKDLRHPIGDVPTCDLILCIEVLSIVDSSAHQAIIENIKKLGRRILLGVGAGKRFGLESKMEEAGFRRGMEYEEKLRQTLEPWKRKMAIKALYYGMLYFEFQGGA
jgi:SAM-dependent methyltransferase